MPPTPHNRKEAFSRVLIDNQLRDAGWRLDDGVSVRYEYRLPDGTFADYVLCDRNGRSLAVVEAKRTSKSPRAGEAQGRAYAEQLTDVPFVFLANGEEVLFWDYRAEAHPRPIAGFFSQGDLERRLAGRQLRVDPLSKPIDLRIVERDYQRDCIDTLCNEINAGRRKLLVEMATGTGKTRTAAALIKRLFDASAVTRVLFLVDRITLAKQTEDAFTEHLRDLPCYMLRAGRRFQDEKRITITTLQSMINVYRDYSPGYFDLIITDECHRSIYGQWSGILKYFDGIQIGLTATPCTAAIEATGDEEDKLFVRDTLRFFEVERPTYRYTLREAVNDGHLVPYQIYKAKTVKTAAEGGFPVRRGEIDWSALSAAERDEFEKLFQVSDPIMVDPNALERRFTIPERNRAIVREYREVLANGYLDKQGVQRKPLIGKTIVFAVTKRHAETLAQMFDDAFAHEKPSPEVRYADFVVSGCGPDDTVDAATKIKRFKKEKFPQILVSVNMLDTGFDAPEVVNLILARFTKSVVLYRQMRGRGTRKAPGKPLFTMFDFVGVTDFHADDETLPEATIIREGKSKPGVPRTLLTLDVNDRIDPTTREWVTIDENGNLTFLDIDARQQTQVAARFEMWLSGRDDLHSDARRLLLSIGAYLKANAGTLEDFTTDHFMMPPFANSGGLPRAIQTFGGEEQLRTVLESMSQAVFADDDTGQEAIDQKFL